jgi:hypothetical protein
MGETEGAMMECAKDLNMKDVGHGVNLGDYWIKEE